MTEDVLPGRRWEAGPRGRSWAGTLSVVIATVAGCSSLRGAPADSRDEWHRVLIADRPAGYLRTTHLPLAGGGARVTTRLKLQVARADVPIELVASTVTEEDGEGRISRFVVEQRMSRRTTTVEGVVKGRDLEFTTTVQGSKPRTDRAPYDPRAIGPHRVEEVLKKRLRTEGDSVELTVFFPEALRCGSQKVTFGPVEEVALPQGSRRLRRMEEEIEILPASRLTSWVDDEFRTWKSVMPFLGMKMVTIRTSEEEIVRDDITTPPEIFVATSIPVDRRIPPEAKVVTYRVRKRDGQLGETHRAGLTATRNQKVLREDPKGVYVLEVRELQPRNPLPRPVEAPEELKRHLEPNTYVQSDHPKIVKTARDAIGGEKDSWAAARKLERWVHANVRRKNLHTAFATAQEVIETLEGDCTEHAVLLAALARASGIPARTVVGLVHARQAFFGHMWTEVWVGEWVALDATAGDGRVGADHIALGTSALGTASISELFLGLVNTLGELEIEVLKIGAD